MNPIETLVNMLKQIKELIGLEPSKEYVMEQVLEIVKTALEKKIMDRKQNFVSLLNNEFYIWLRITIGPKQDNSFWQKPISEAKVQSINALVNGVLMTIKQLNGRIIVDLNKVETIANEVTIFNNSRTAYLSALNVIKRIIETAVVNPGMREDTFAKRKNEVILDFERVSGEKLETYHVQSRKRKTRKNNKTRKHK
jgi:hypothetical protein